MIDQKGRNTTMRIERIYEQNVTRETFGPDRVYVELTEDVENPSPDRRQKRNFWAAETWKAGSKLVLRRVPINGEYHRWIVSAEGGYRGVSVADPQGSAFRGKLREREATAAELLDEANVHATQFADPEAVRRISKRIIERWEQVLIELGAEEDEA